MGHQSMVTASALPPKGLLGQREGSGLGQVRVLQPCTGPK